MYLAGGALGRGGQGQGQGSSPGNDWCWWSFASRVAPGWGSVGQGEHFAIKYWIIDEKQALLTEKLFNLISLLVFSAQTTNTPIFPPIFLQDIPPWRWPVSAGWAPVYPPHLRMLLKLLMSTQTGGLGWRAVLFVLKLRLCPWTVTFNPGTASDMTGWVPRIWRHCHRLQLHS